MAKTNNSKFVEFVQGQYDTFEKSLAKALFTGDHADAQIACLNAEAIGLDIPHKKFTEDEVEQACFYAAKDAFAMLGHLDRVDQHNRLKGLISSQGFVFEGKKAWVFCARPLDRQRASIRNRNTGALVYPTAPKFLFEIVDEDFVIDSNVPSTHPDIQSILLVPASWLQTEQQVAR